MASDSSEATALPPTEGDEATKRFQPADRPPADQPATLDVTSDEGQQLAVPSGEPSFSPGTLLSSDQAATLDISSPKSSETAPLKDEQKSPLPMATSTSTPQDSGERTPTQEAAGKLEQAPGLRVVQEQQSNVSERLGEFKNWSVSQLKSTRQVLSESFGRGSKTVDAQLDDRVGRLRKARGKYAELLKLAQKHCTLLRQTIATQRSLAAAFGEFAAKEQALREQLSRNCDTQRQVARNGEILLAALSTFIASLTTLLSTTMEDTFQQLREYETARIEYDAYRNDEEAARVAMQAVPSDEKRKARFGRKQQEAASRKKVFQQLRRDLTVRVHFLEENQLKVRSL